MSYRLRYYEDDVVTYTSRGYRPIIPDKYKYCFINNQKYKSFFREIEAKIALNYKTNQGKYYYGRYNEDTDPFVIFKCNKCGMYHIMHKSNYKKLKKYDR